MTGTTLLGRSFNLLRRHVLVSNLLIYNAWNLIEKHAEYFAFTTFNQ